LARFPTISKLETW